MNSIAEENVCVCEMGRPSMAKAFNQDSVGPSWAMKRGRGFKLLRVPGKFEFQIFIHLLYWNFSLTSKQVKHDIFMDVF